MRTTVLAYVIAFMGVVTALGGLYGLFVLLIETVRMPLRYYAFAIAMIAGGVGMFGIAQALRNRREGLRGPCQTSGGRETRAALLGTVQIVRWPKKSPCSTCGQ